MDVTSINKDFKSIPLTSIYAEKSLPGDLYFYIAGKYIKYLNKQDSMPKEKLEYLSLKRFEHLFVKTKDLPSFKNWANSIVVEKKSEIIAEVGQNLEEVVDKHSVLNREVVSFVTKDVTDASIKELVSKTREFLHSMQDKMADDQFLLQMAKFDQGIVDHASKVANVATFLGMSIGFNSPEALENIYLGGLLHDFGKTRVNPKYLDKPKSEIYKSAMRKHPSLGKTALLLEGSFSDDVFRIIGEHHERHDGKGYPKGIRGKRIFDLTKLVAIANAFDKVVDRSEAEDLKSKQLEAIDRLRLEGGRHFDPRVLASCIRALQEVI